MLGLAYYPFVTLLTVSGLRSMDRSQEEAALLSRGKWQTLRRVTLPLTTPHILTGAIFVFVFSIMDFGVPDILRVSVYPVEIFVQFSTFYDERAAAILSLASDHRCVGAHACTKMAHEGPGLHQSGRRRLKNLCLFAWSG